MFVKRVEECRYMRLLVLFKWVKKLYSVYEALEYKKKVRRYEKISKYNDGVMYYVQPCRM